jgi:hypothetical protein
VSREAFKQIEALVFPLAQRVSTECVSQADVAALLRGIRKERGAEVRNLLYDICVEITWSCLDLGIQKDDLIEAMTDKRVRQRRLR